MESIAKLEQKSELLDIKNQIEKYVEELVVLSKKIDLITEQSEEQVFNTERKYYVYQFINEDWSGLPFYVGKGSGNRYKQLTDRSQHIQNIWNNYPCKVQILEVDLTELEACVREKYYKKKYKSEGKPIIDGEANTIHRLAQAEGIAAAKAAGKHIGRPQIVKPNNWGEVYIKWKSNKITGIQAMKEANLKKSSFYKLAKQEAKEKV